MEEELAKLSRRPIPLPLPSEKTDSLFDTGRITRYEIQFENFSTDEVLEVIRSIGVVVHREEAADSLIRETRSALDSVQARTASRPRVRAILLIGFLADLLPLVRSPSLCQIDDFRSRDVGGAFSRSNRRQ